MESVGKLVVKTYRGRALAILRPFSKAGTINYECNFRKSARRSNGIENGIKTRHFFPHRIAFIQSPASEEDISSSSLFS